MADEIGRLFNFEAEVVLTRGQTQKDALTTDLALFTARLPWINAAYLTSYQTDIDTAAAFPDDNTVMTNVKVLTADVNASVEEGKGNLKILFLYSEITYPTDKVKQRVFGQDRMDKARSDQEKMMNLLDHANSFADKAPYKADLIAKGYTQVEIDALTTVADNIRDKNRIQENAIGSRPVTTQDRTIVYNTVFNRMLLINTCAQIVFAGNPAKLAQYRAYPPQSTGTTDTIADVHVISTDTGTGLPSATVTVVGTAISGITDAGGIVLLTLATPPPDSIDLLVTAPGYADQSFDSNAIVAGEDNVIEVSMVK